MKRHEIKLDMDDYTKIKYRPERLTQEEKLARIYVKAKELNVKIGDKYARDENCKYYE